MSLRASSPSAQKLDCARWFESVPERNNAKDPAPLKVKEVWVKERRVAIPPYFARTPVIAPDGKCSAKRLLASRKSLNVNDLIFQTVEDGSKAAATR